MSLETVSISTNKYVTTVDAMIDGHAYKVRKIGAGTQLDLSREISTLARMRTDLLNIDAQIKKAKNDEEAEELMQKNFDKIDNFNKTVNRIEDIFVELFDDNEDGKKSKKLVHALGIENIQKVYDEIFDKAEQDADK